MTSDKVHIFRVLLILIFIFSILFIVLPNNIELEPEYVFIEQPPGIPVTTPTPISEIELTKIEILQNDIIKNDIGNKGYYSFDGGSKDVHVCGKMSCEQCEYIKMNYNYSTGIVLLMYKYLGVSHAQTWVIIDNERFILESTDNYWWTEEDHKNKFNNDYKIKFVTLNKGKEMVKESDEYTRTGKKY